LCAINPTRAFYPEYIGSLTVKTNNIRSGKFAQCCTLVIPATGEVELGGLLEIMS
jgi:hypothetical protein